MSHHAGICTAVLPAQITVFTPWMMLHVNSHTISDGRATVRDVQCAGTRPIRSTAQTKETMGSSARIAGAGTGQRCRKRSKRRRGKDRKDNAEIKYRYEHNITMGIMIWEAR